MPVPRKMRCRIVSAWSSAVCAVTTKRAAQPGGRRFEELIAGPPGSGFQSVAALRAGQVEPHAAHFAGHAQPPAQLDDQGLVGLGFRGSQLMIEVGGHEAAFAGGL